MSVGVRSNIVQGWTLAILMWTVLFGAVVRSWRIVDTLWGSPDWSALGFIPAAAGVDFCFALLVMLLCGVFVWSTSNATRSLRLGGRLASVAIVVFVALLGTANLLSFRVTGSAITWQRLRGDDGATARDIDLVAWRELQPVLILLALALVSLAVVLWKSPAFERINVKRRSVALGAFVVVSLALLALYEARFDGKDRGYGRHPAGVLLESVLDNFRKRPTLVKEFVAPPVTKEAHALLLQPTSPSPPVPAPQLASTKKTKNVIVFFSEGIARKHTSLSEGGPDTTPLLKARARREGLEMTRFYSPFHRSIQAIYSLFCGEFPTPNGVSISEINPRIDCGEFSQTLAPQGVHVGLFHGGYFSFYDKTAFLADRGFERMMDAPSLLGRGPQRPDGKPWESDQWGVDDRVTVAALLAWIDEVRAKGEDARFAAVAIPITAHYPYSVPADVDEPFGQRRKLDRFWNAVHFLDIAFDELMTGLDERHLLDDTMVIFLADHGESPLEPARETNVDRAMYEHNVHVPMVIFDRQLFPKRQVSERLASIPDILPTVIDVMGLRDSRVRQGTSFLSENWQEKRVFLGTARSNFHQIGFIEGTHKFVFDLDRARTEYYDLVADPDEMQNQAGLFPELMSTNTRLALTWEKWQYRHIADMAPIDEDVDVQAGIARAARFTLTTAAGVVSCGDNDDAELPGYRICPGFPRALDGMALMRSARRRRLCLPVVVPPNGSVDIDVSDVPFWRYVSSLRFARPSSTPAKAVAVTLRIDDQPRRTLDTTGRAEQRFLFGAPSQSLHVTLTSTEPTPAPLCLFFDEASWKPRSRNIRAWERAWPQPLDPNGPLNDEHTPEFEVPDETGADPVEIPSEPEDDVEGGPLIPR